MTSMTAASEEQLEKKRRTNVYERHVTDKTTLSAKLERGKGPPWKWEGLRKISAGISIQVCRTNLIPEHVND